jgi:hypothetical protein
MKGKYISHAVLDDFVQKYLSVKPPDLLYPVGSFGRGEEMSGDLDMLVLGDKLTISFPHRRVSGGDNHETYEILTDPPFQMDVFYLPHSKKSALPFSLLQYLGPKEENIRLRTAAKRQGYKLNQYGLYQGDKRTKVKSIDGVYRLLGVSRSTPLLRNVPGDLINRFAKDIGVSSFSYDGLVFTTAEKLRLRGMRHRKSGDRILVQPEYLDGYIRVAVELGRRSKF